MSIKKLLRNISITFLIFLLYCAYWPLSVTKYTLTDGKNTIVFQTMIHLAQPSLYKNVEADIKTYHDNGYKFLYEGIRPSKVKNDDKNPADVPDFSISAWMLGLTSQNDGDYFSVAEKLGSNADVDEDFLVERLDRAGLLDKGIAGDKDDKSSKPLTKEDIVKLKKIKEEIKPLVPILFLPLMRMSDRFALMEEYFSELTNSHSPMSEIIIVDRNQFMYNCVKQAGNKIYINYGAAHFYNFYNLLKNDNSNWHIVEEENYTAF